VRLSDAISLYMLQDHTGYQGIAVVCSSGLVVWRLQPSTPVHRNRPRLLHQPLQSHALALWCTARAISSRRVRSWLPWPAAPRHVGCGQVHANVLMFCESTRLPAKLPALAQPIRCPSIIA